VSTNIFVNLPIRDLNRSVEFFSKLGYKFNAQFTNENATCMIVADDIYVMLLVERFFQTFTPKPVADATASTEVIVALSCDSSEEVKRIVDLALANGAGQVREPQDLGFMYSRAFADLDGHVWEYFWMDPAHVQG
jgi:uncharacterized protein